ncbi:sigma-54 interaction domain-containing protein [Desulfoplanes formicivorans]|uniref:Fis family transcriptional regulator n=1 Tax=Desulfoplanes formicivorans TaxID=1592317 RepID=A0A194ALH0_9BACT|nr:sigma-54 dependent transcriptional regulator [Desulfoplanes formicivorans]GAU09876.1 Fis family transcriptional regulator [Desulfoplanes formicivorans]
MSEIIAFMPRGRDMDVLQQSVPGDVRWQDTVRDVVGTASAAMREVFSKVRHVAPTGTTVLLTGETGTGKSLIARILHNHSARRDRPFVSVHCGAIPDTLTESELFGHEKGAFTGAVRRKPGKFELAQGGTIFLDEIGTISPSVQIKLLDVVQERVFQRVGGDRDIRIDVRIIAATNEDLRQLSAGGLFRKDLYYRLNVFPIHVPPLRERQEDIPRLVELFIRRCNIQLRKKIQGVHPDVVRGFMQYDWPGNVRELENLIERACILEDGHILSPDRFPEECFQGSPSTRPAAVDASLPIATARRLVVDRFERAYLDRLLLECAGAVTPAAKRAGITTRQLRKLMVRHGVDRKKYARGHDLVVQEMGKENP